MASNSRHRGGARRASRGSRHQRAESHDVDREREVGASGGESPRSDSRKYQDPENEYGGPRDADSPVTDDRGGRERGSARGRAEWSRPAAGYEADYGFPQMEDGYWAPPSDRNGRDDSRRNPSESRRGGGYGANDGWDRDEGEEQYGPRGRWGDDRSGQGGYRLGTYETDRARYRDSWYGGGYLGAGSQHESGQFDETARNYPPLGAEISYHAPEPDRRPRRGPHSGKGPRGYQRSDERIREDVCENLHRDGAIDASEIDVDVQNGEVTLGGTVPDRRMKRLAEDCAADCTGVRDVHNALRVGDGSDRSGESVRAGESAGRDDKSRRRRAGRRKAGEARP